MTPCVDRNTKLDESDSGLRNNWRERLFVLRAPDLEAAPSQWVSFHLVVVESVVFACAPPRAFPKTLLFDSREVGRIHS